MGFSQQVGSMQLNNSRLQMHQIAAAAAAVAYPGFASLGGVVPSGGLPTDLSGNPGLAPSNYLPFGTPSTSMSYSAAVNGGFGPAGRGANSDGQAGDSAGNEFHPYGGSGLANGNGRTTTYSSGGGSSSVVAAFEGGNGGQAAANSGNSGSGELFQPMRGDGVQRGGMDEDVSGGGHAQELTSSQLQVHCSSSASLVCLFVRWISLLQSWLQHLCVSPE